VIARQIELAGVFILQCYKNLKPGYGYLNILEWEVGELVVMHVKELEIHDAA
jgi:hypothetical protein